MSTPEFKSLRQELRVAISKMECYKNAIYDEKEIERIYNDSNLLEEEILGKASYINREELFILLTILGSPYQSWDYSDSEWSVIGTLWHSFEWVYFKVVSLMIIAITAILVVIFVKRNK